jgi:uncharacterized protein (TIGR02466 family)
MVHYLFPIPIYTVNAEDTFTKEHEQLNKFEITAKQFDEFGEKSVNTYILDDYRLSNLTRWIVQQVNRFSTQELHKDANAGDFVLLQSWISVKYPGQSHAAHIHPNSVISGVYYWEPVVQPITFVNSKPVEIGPTQLNNYTFTLSDIQPGTLVLFPSHLKHTVAVNNTDTPRKSLAFNSIPTKGFGSRNQLTEIDLVRLKHKLIDR